MCCSYEFTESRTRPSDGTELNWLISDKLVGKGSHVQGWEKFVAISSIYYNMILYQVESRQSQFTL